MHGPLQDLLRHCTEPTIEAKDRVRIDRNMAIRVGTADPVVDEIRFRESFRCFIILVSSLF